MRKNKFLASSIMMFGIGVLASCDLILTPPPPQNSPGTSKPEQCFKFDGINSATNEINKLKITCNYAQTFGGMLTPSNRDQTVWLLSSEDPTALSSVANDDWILVPVGEFWSGTSQVSIPLETLGLTSPNTPYLIRVAGTGNLLSDTSNSSCPVPDGRNMCQLDDEVILGQ